MLSVKLVESRFSFIMQSDVGSTQPLMPIGIANLLVLSTSRISIMRTKFLIFTLMITLLVLGMSSTASGTNRAAAATAAATQAPSGGMMMDNTYNTNELAPLAKAYFDGKDVFFIHPEASDPDVAGVLTKMMGPQVLTVPSLAKVAPELLGNVYVFTNGVKGMGPLGFQPDVFDTIPGDKTYTPLRAVSLVSWKEKVTPVELKSVAAIKAAETAGQLEIKQPGVVVNMPILVWPGGKR